MITIHKVEAVKTNTTKNVSFGNKNEPIPEKFNLIELQRPEDIIPVANNFFGTTPHRIATVGFSSPPEGYADSTKKFLTALRDELGVRSTGFITRPTTNKGSIGAITTGITGMPLYLTAQDYVPFINPDRLPPDINQQVYSKAPKYVLPNSSELAKATATVSNALVITGGRYDAVKNFVHSVQKGNKIVIFHDPALGNTDKSNVTGYLVRQLEAFKAGRKLPDPECNGLSREFLEKHDNRISKLVKTVVLEHPQESHIPQFLQIPTGFITQRHIAIADSGIFKAAKEAAKHLKAK